MTGEQPSTGPQILRREVWFDVPEYPGFQIKLWINYPHSLRQDLRSGNPERYEPALQAIVLEHNGWRDFDGEPYPQPSTREFWDRIPDELATILIYLIINKPYQLPNSLSSAGATLTSSASG